MLIRLFLCFLCFSLLFAEKVSVEDFLVKVRSSIRVPFWFRSYGELEVRFKDESIEELEEPITIKTVTGLFENKIYFQIILDSYQEIKLRYDRENQIIKKQTILADYNFLDSYYKKLAIRPYDLSISFLFWDFIHEFPRESLRIGLLFLSTRVLFLSNPHTDDEFVKIWISEKYYSPLKIEWYKGGVDSFPYQKLEIRAIKKVSGVYLPSSVIINNIQAKIRVDYDKFEFGIKSLKEDELFLK